MTISKIGESPFPPDSSSGANPSKGPAPSERIFPPPEDEGSETAIRDTKVVSQEVIKFKDKDDGKKYSAVETKTHETDAGGIEYNCTEIVYTNSAGKEVSVKERKHSGTKDWGDGHKCETVWTTEITKSPGKTVVVNKVEDPYFLDIQTTTTIGLEIMKTCHKEAKCKLCKMPEWRRKEASTQTGILKVRNNEVVSE